MDVWSGSEGLGVDADEGTSFERRDISDRTTKELASKMTHADAIREREAFMITVCLDTK